MWPKISRRFQGQRRHLRLAEAALAFEALEPRWLLSVTLPEADLSVIAADPPDAAVVHKAIVAGDPSGSPADSPAGRVDANTTTSPFAGVGSLFMDLGDGTGFLCSGSLISPTHALTAGHCLDIDDNGTADFSPGDVSFFLNYGSDFSHTLTATALHLHPDFTGFANPSVLDDIAIVELASAAPAGVPIYGVNTEAFEFIETITLAGYGTTGDGVSGYIDGSHSFTVKRTGMNRAEAALSDDEGSGVREGFEWDFDGAHKKTNVFGPPQGSNLTLGNNVETTVGGGDSGGPSFIDDGSGGLLVFGVNTFTIGQKAPAPLFGSAGGGVVVSAYAGWINSIVGGVNQAPTADAGDDQGVTIGDVVQLDGSGSSDPESDPLSYSWTLSAPTGSNALLSDPTAVNPTFVADVDGSYVVTLVVNDGQNDSSPDSATITVAPVGTSMHVGDLDGASQVKGKSGKWSANVSVNIHDNNDGAVAGATVTGQWSGATSGTVSGVTEADGTVTFSTGNLNGGTSVTFEVTNVTGTLSYNAAANHDPDGDSNGTTITVEKANSTRAAAEVRDPRASSSQANSGLSTALWLAKHRQPAVSAQASDKIDANATEPGSVEAVIGPAVRDIARVPSLDRSAVDRVLGGSTAHEDVLDDLELELTDSLFNALIDEVVRGMGS